MLNSELIEALIKQEQEDYKEHPAENDIQQAFHEGFIFAYKYLLVLLRKTKIKELQKEIEEIKKEK